MKMYLKLFYVAVAAALGRNGLVLGAIALELTDKAAVDALPEFQRSWYEEDSTTKKYKLNPGKVDVEDTTALKATVQATREEVRQAKVRQEAAVKEALKKYDGIDPDKAREMLNQFASEEEKKLIASGPDGIKKVVEGRMEKQREEMATQVEKAIQERDGALEVASAFMQKVLDNEVRAAAMEAGIHPGAIEDALLRARDIFSINDDGDAVQYEEDGETVVIGKDGKTPFKPKEWIESMKVKAPHWFPAAGSGGGAQGNKGAGGKPDLSHLSPTARMTAVREGTVKK